MDTPRRERWASTTQINHIYSSVLLDALVACLSFYLSVFLSACLSVCRSLCEHGVAILAPPALWIAVIITTRRLALIPRQAVAVAW